MKTQTKDILVVVGAAIGLWVLYEAITNGLEALNPFNNGNIINNGFNSAYQSLTGSSGTLGSDLYDLLNPNAANGSGTSSSYFVYDANGNLVQSPDGSGPETSSSPPGSSGNPYPNPDAASSSVSPASLSGGGAVDSLSDNIGSGGLTGFPLHAFGPAPALAPSIVANMAKNSG
ncbi:MAG: hypothetical protein WBR15_10840 [Gammaproteobacteria bacterium]